MTVVTVDRPTRIADMGRQEAESVTQAIKDNFDSLGSMLIQARDRKAYKALGYRTFEGYCKTEFGKSISSAYRLIEDAKVVAQIESEIAKQYDEPITLNIPSACLRPLKEIPDVREKLRAIEYAKKLAAAEGKNPTKKHLEVAVFEISGKRSEDFRNAIQSLGFTKSVPVEVTTSRKKDRGIITRIDKLGKIHVQLYYGEFKSIPFDASELRILTDAEKPAHPLDEIIASKGDRVLIFALGLGGKKGTIYQAKEGRQALVTLDGESSPTYIAYAEMELLRGEKEEANWESELVWEAGKNKYYYFPQEDTIYSDIWPQGLALKPHSHEKSPIEFVEDWEDKFAGSLLESLANPAKIKTLALAQAIELPEDEGKEFATDLIASLSQLFPQQSPKPKAMGISFALTINELLSGKKTQTRRAWQDDYAKNFIRYFDENIAIPALNKGRHRGGHELGFIKLTQRPYQQYLSEMSLTDLQEEGGMVGTVQEFIDTYFEGKDKLVWVLHFEFLTTPSDNNTSALIDENQRLREQLADAESAIEEMITAASTVTDFLLENTAEISSPGESAAHTDFLLENTAEISGVDTINTSVDTSKVICVDTVDTDVDATEIDSWRQILETNYFIPVPFKIDGRFKGHWRGWNFFFHTPNGGVIAIDIANKYKEEMFTRCTEHNFDIDLGDEYKISKWVKALINQIEDFCPGQLSLDLPEQNPVVDIVDTSVDTVEAQRETDYDDWSKWNASAAALASVEKPEGWSQWEKDNFSWLLNGVRNCFYKNQYREIEAFLPEQKKIRLRGMRSGEEYIDMWAVESPTLDENGNEASIQTFDKTFPDEILTQVQETKEKLLQDIQQCKKAEKSTKKPKELKAIELSEIRTQQRIEILDKFLFFRIGQKVVETNRIEYLPGIVKGVTLSTGGIPSIFVRWQGQSSSTPEIVNMLAIEEE